VDDRVTGSGCCMSSLDFVAVPLLHRYHGSSPSNPASTQNSKLRFLQNLIRSQHWASALHQNLKRLVSSEPNTVSRLSIPATAPWLLRHPQIDLTLPLDDVDDRITGADDGEVKCWWRVCLASKPNAVQWKPKQEHDEERPEVEQSVIVQSK